MPKQLSNLCYTVCKTTRAPYQAGVQHIIVEVDPASNEAGASNSTSPMLPEGQEGITMVSILNPPDAGQAEPSGTTRNGCEWGDEDTKTLLKLYREYLPHIGPSKKFRTKKEMYKKISEEIKEQTGQHRTGEQCENRFKTIKKRKKGILSMPASLCGAGSRTLKFNEELRQIGALEDGGDTDMATTHESMSSARSRLAPSTSSAEDDEDMAEEQQQREQSESSESSCSAPRKPKVKRTSRAAVAAAALTARSDHMKLFFEGMRQLHDERQRRDDERERKREQRHAEKMAVLWRILSVLERDGSSSQPRLDSRGVMRN